MRRDQSCYRNLARIAFVAVLLPALGVAAVNAGEPLFAGFGAGARGLLGQPMKARTVESLDLSFVIPNDFIDQILSQGAQTQIACTFEAKNGGKGQRGVKVEAEGTVSVGSQFVTNLGPVNGRTNSNGTYGATFPIGVPGPVGAPITVDMKFNPSGGKRITTWYAECVALVNRQTTM